ncbi:MAG: S41 family peptidase [Acetatifactor sp.]|nr:S41 family peptidase [Acetatifactor sp.]
MDENETYFDYTVTNVPPANPSPVKEKGSGKGLFLIGLMVGIAATLLIVGIGYLGFRLQAVMGQHNQPVLSENSFVDEKLVSKLQLLEEYIDKLYFLDEVSDEDLQTGIYRGLMNALNDPYSVYYSAEELNSFMQQTEGTYYGIGAYMTQDTDTGLPLVTGLIPGTPAETGGLRADDLIYEVNGEPVYGMTLEQAIALIKGPEGTDVTLTIIRENAEDFVQLTLTRARVETPTVTLTMLENNMAYIEILEFDSVSVDQFAEALAVARGSGMEGLILDLRGNPGGSLDAVVDMCRMILPKGMIVYTENKSGKRSEYTCDGKKELEVPLVVLTDGNSASAAEIMAGAIKDYRLGTLVGTTTFGKGIVQQVVPLLDGSAVKLTISAYYTPNGNNIHGIGIEPDVECPFDGEAYYGSEEHPDNQLEKAKEVLKGLMGK